jgi:hypothetical protein
MSSKVMAGHLQQAGRNPATGSGDADSLQRLEQHRLVRGDHRLAEARFDIRDTFDGPHVGAGQDEGLRVGVIGAQREGGDVPGRQRALPSLLSARPMSARATVSIPISARKAMAMSLIAGT